MPSLSQMEEKGIHSDLKYHNWKRLQKPYIYLYKVKRPQQLVLQQREAVTMANGQDLLRKGHGTGDWRQGHSFILSWRLFASGQTMQTVLGTEGTRKWADLDPNWALKLINCFSHIISWAPAPSPTSWEYANSTCPVALVAILWNDLLKTVAHPRYTSLIWPALLPCPSPPNRSLVPVQNFDS